MSYKPLITSLQNWVTEASNPASSDKQSYQNLDALIERVSKVPFERGLGKDLSLHLRKIQNVVKDEEVNQKIESVKKSVFPEEVSDRVARCREIVEKGYEGVEDLIENFDKFELEEASFSDRLELFNKIEKHGTWAGNSLIENFEKFGFIKDLHDCKTLEDCASLFEKIVKKRYWLAVILTKNVDEILKRDTLLEDRLSFYHMIVKQGECGACALAHNFKKLGLEKASVFDRIALCKEIALTGKDAAGELVRKFDKLGIVEAPLSARLEFYESLEKSKVFPEQVLQNIFSMLKVTEDFQECKSEEERLSLFKKIVKICYCAARGLIRDFDKLGLKELPIADRFALFEEIRSLDYRHNLTLIKYFNIFGFIEDFQKLRSVEERLTLFKMIAEQGEWTTRGLIQNIDKLGIKEAPISELLALFKNYAKLYEEVASDLTGRIEKFGLERAAASERVAFCKALAKGSTQAATFLSCELYMVNFKGVSVSERISLCMEIAKQGIRAASSLVYVFNILGSNDFEKAQILFELLTLPSEIRKEFKGLIDKKFVAKVKPILSFLLNEEDDFDFEEFDKCMAKTPMKDLYVSIQKQTKQRMQLTRWAGYSAGVLFDLDKDKINTEKTDKILECIYHHRNPSNRFAFIRHLRSLLDLEDLVIPDFKGGKSRKAVKKQERSILSWVLLSRMEQIGFFKGDKSLKFIHDKICSISGFDDTKKFDSLVKFLLLVIDEVPYKDKEIKLIEDAISSSLATPPKKAKKHEGPRKREVEVISNKLHVMRNVWTIFGKEKLIKCIKSKRDIESYFQEKFQALFGLEEMDDFGENYQETFGGFRDKTALFSYLRSLENLASEEKNTVKKTFSEYVSGVLRGIFPSIRYDVDKNPHLKFLFEGSADLKQNWLEGDQPKVFKAETCKPVKIDYLKLLKTKILTDKHLNPDDYPCLRDYLQGNKPKLSQIDDPKEKFQKLAIALCQDKIKAEDFICKVRNLKLDLGEFKNDLNNLIPQKSFGEYQISESDEPCNLLLIGTETSSCQSVDGNPELNKCLTGYLMNGEIRPIIVKSGKKIVARCLLRLMWDDKNKTPVLLQERIYSNVQDATIIKEIEAWAIKKAEKMGIPLVSREVGSGKSYDGTVKFLGGRAPFVYSDSSGGALSGPFETVGCHFLYLPL